MLPDVSSGFGGNSFADNSMMASLQPSTGTPSTQKADKTSPETSPAVFSSQTAAFRATASMGKTSPITTSTKSARRGDGPTQQVSHNSPGQDLVHVCFCTDDLDLRSLAVAMNSSLSNAADATRLMFHIITTPEKARDIHTRLASQLPWAKIQIHHDAELQARIESQITFRKSSGSRKSLASPFNFAPFYLDAFLGVNSVG